MGGVDENGGIVGDWMLPSPNTQSVVAAMLGDGAGSQSRPVPVKNDNDNANGNDGGFTFPGPDRQKVLEKNDGNQRGETVDQVMKTGESDEHKMGERAGLVERMAARAGHNAPRLNTDIIKPVGGSQNQQQQSAYLTISPNLSPGAFLDSPVFLSNSLVQPSPTTGKFQFAPNDNNGNKSKDNFFEESNNASFAFKPFPDPAPLPRDHVSKVNSPFMSTRSFQSNEAAIRSENQFPPHQKIEPAQNYSDFIEKNNFSLQMTPFQPLNGNSGRTQQHHEEQHHDDNEAYQRINGDITNANSTSSDDGYNWRKYGQKQVKGSEYPRSYYKCTHANCNVKKKVERSHEGHITEIIYKGAHNHPKLAPNRRSGMGSSNVLSDMQGDINEQNGNGNGADGGQVWGANMQQGCWAQESNFEVTSSGVVMQGQNGQFESSDAVDGSSTFSNDEEDDRATHCSVSLGYDGEGDESESKRRKVEAYAADVSGATRAIREPRVVVQTTSEVDILDDGYRWRKYGQKVVKGNPNPRSYYKCTSAGCTVRKHVERASHDLKSVITTYEGKHNHDVPAHKNNHNNNASTAQQALSIHSQVHISESSRIPNTMARFERPPYGLPNGQQLGPTTTHGYGYPINQQGPRGLAQMAMAKQGTMPVLPVHHYLNQPQQMNEMGFMVPKSEPKVEPMSDPGLNLANGALNYRQMMNRLPLGPQM